MLPESDESSPQTWFYRGFSQCADPERSADRRQRATRAHTLADRLVAATPEATHRACAAGCAACCHLPVGVTAAEAEVLAAALTAALAATALAELRDRLHRTAQARRQLSWSELADRRPRCPLLGDDDRCIAYAARPIACRGWTSASRDACEDLLRGSPGPPPPFDAAALHAALGVHAGLAAADDDPHTYELASALALALDPDARAAGPPTDFTGCRRVDDDQS